MKPKRSGSYQRFKYPNFGTPETYPDYRAHSNQIVRIVRRLRDDEVGDPSIQPMYLIQAKDGWTGHACHDELKTIKS